MLPPRLVWPKIICWTTDVAIIRQVFNACQYYDKATSGVVKTTIFKSKHRSPATEPYCTHSQLLVYWESGNPVALVHQYLRPDGKIGASGKPDPKRVVIGNRVIALRASAKL